MPAFTRRIPGRGLCVAIIGGPTAHRAEDLPDAEYHSLAEWREMAARIEALPLPGGAHRSADPMAAFRDSWAHYNRKVR